MGAAMEEVLVRWWLAVLYFTYEGERRKRVTCTYSHSIYKR